MKRQAHKLITPGDVDAYAAIHNWVLLKALEREEAYLTPEGSVVVVYYNKTGEGIKAIITEMHVTGIG